MEINGNQTLQSKTLGEGMRQYRLRRGQGGGSLYGRVCTEIQTYRRLAPLWVRTARLPAGRNGSPPCGPERLWPPRGPERFKDPPCGPERLASLWARTGNKGNRKIRIHSHLCGSEREFTPPCRSNAKKRHPPCRPERSREQRWVKHGAPLPLGLTGT